MLTLEQIAAPQGDESVRSYLERGLSDWQEIKSEYEAALEALEAAPEDASALERFGQAESRFGLLDGYAYPARIDAALSALGSWSSPQPTPLSSVAVSNTAAALRSCC